MPHLRHVRIVSQEKLAERTYRLRLICPEIARVILPGQFLMLRLAGTNDPLLGRPFALYDTWGDDSSSPLGVDIVYLVVGSMTSRLCTVPAGSVVEVWGPLGRPLPAFSELEQVVLVAGGIGQTPFVAYTHWLLGSRGYGGQAARPQARRVLLYYGVRTAARLAGLTDFQTAGAQLYLASDDGSVGWHGSILDRLQAEQPAGPLIGCGPEPMLKALARLARQWQRPCWVSLETPMACGIGACFSCVTRIGTAHNWDYRRVCVDGPTFEAALWHDAFSEQGSDAPLGSTGA
ncbi:MAG: dihydroorotate dehydrogenase electron transfer subunit [Gemmataceae bacterium]|nr:dihydroorotate dehydrogenase electron transfer subunit [Gemmataceae bacterium]MCS7269675.1 dihydroorotate dehydrogenase electron transfer subunit [Gemmataceae bacterium]MDW8243580.1 dihydroorotate dehydrogenase electron transfer subunit [Thermogemmata sp.]